MPAKYGGSELGLAEATVMMQTIAEAGGGYTASSSVHMNIFGLAPVVIHLVMKHRTDRALTDKGEAILSAERAQQAVDLIPVQKPTVTARLLNLGQRTQPPVVE